MRRSDSMNADGDGNWPLEDIDPESRHIREVYANFGLAMYAAQVLENGIINLVVWSGVRDGTYRTYEETETANAELFRQTMGSVRKALLSRRPDTMHLDDRLTRSVRLRNFLAHEYFRQRAAAFMTEDGRDRMIKELKSAVAFFQEADGKLDSLTAGILEATGMRRHLPEAMESARQAGFGNPLPGL